MPGGAAGRDAACGHAQDADDDRHGQVGARACHPDQGGRRGADRELSQAQDTRRAARVVRVAGQGQRGGVRQDQAGARDHDEQARQDQRQAGADDGGGQQRHASGG
jgi:hypothetical protein